MLISKSEMFFFLNKNVINLKGFSFFGSLIVYTKNKEAGHSFKCVHNARFTFKAVVIGRHGMYTTHSPHKSWADAYI